MFKGVIAMEYKLLVVENLCFAYIKRKYYLIDTASPFTYSFRNNLKIDEKKYKNSNFKELLKDRMKKLAKKYNLKLGGIIGLDVISQTGLTIDRLDEKVLFYPTEVLAKEQYSISIKEVNNQKYAVLNNIKVKGFYDLGDASFVLDTGVSYSQLDINLASNAQYGWKVSYYYPSIGYDVTFDVRFFTIKEDDSKRDLMMVELTDKYLLNQLKFIGVNGTLSFNDLKKETLVLDFNKNKLYIA